MLSLQVRCLTVLLALGLFSTVALSQELRINLKSPIDYVSYSQLDDVVFVKFKLRLLDQKDQSGPSTLLRNFTVDHGVLCFPI